MDVYYISQNSRAARKYSRQVIIFVGRNLVCMLFFFHSKNLEKLEGRYNYKMHEQSPCFESRGCDSGFGCRCWILIGWSQRLTNITIPYATSGTSFNSQILRFFFKKKLLIVTRYWIQILCTTFCVSLYALLTLVCHVFDFLFLFLF